MGDFFFFIFFWLFCNGVRNHFSSSSGNPEDTSLSILPLYECLSMVSNDNVGDQ